MGILGTSNDQVIDDLIHARLQNFRKTPYGRENDLPFFVADTTKVIEQHQRWTRALPNIHPFYGQYYSIMTMRTYLIERTARLTKPQR